jgi:Ni,Fe-hydrogenase III small subunit
MRPIGFSTGALAYSNFRRGLEIVRNSHSRVVELSALRESELSPLINALGSLNLEGFTYISVHAPSKYNPVREDEVISLLQQVAERHWPIIIHPDAIQNFSSWHVFKDLLFIENMDKRNITGRTARELTEIFQKLPQAKLCFDLGHCRQVDPTMNESYLILQQFRARLGQLHVSEVNSRSTHDSLSDAAVCAFEKIASMIPEDVPVILESPISSEEVQSEIHRARLALPVNSSSNGNAKREAKHFQVAFP